MSDLKIQGVVEMNAEGAERALDRVGDKAAQMAAKTETAAGKAGKAVDKIGDGASGSADQLTRAEGRMVASIKRVQTQFELAGKTASQKLEFNIDAKGLDASKFEPYLAQLRATEAAHARVATGAAEAAGKMAGLAAVAAGGAFAMWIKGAIDTADSLNDLSKSTSIAVETLAGLKLASKQSGAELEGTAQAINKLSVNMGANAAKFAAIGVTAKEPLEAFKQLADVFSKIEDPQMKAAFGAEALGKSWAAAAPLLAEGGQSIQDMVDKGLRLSGVTQKLADDADAFNDVLEEWKAGLAGVASGIASGLLPVMLAMSENMSAVTGKADGMNSSFSPVTETLRAVAVLGGNVAFVLRAVGTEFGGMAAQVAAAARGDFAGAKAIGKMMTEDAAQARSAFDKWESGVLSAGEAVAKAKKEVEGLTDAQKESVKAFAAAGKAAKESRGDFTELFQRAEQMKTIYAALGVELKEIDKEYADQAKALEAIYGPLEKEAAALEAQAEAYGLTRAEIERTTLKRLEEQKAMANQEGMTDLVANLEREIAARKRIAEASASIDARKATDDAAKHAASEWQKTSDKIGDSITDALMRGFESGKSFAETLRDTVVNMFKTMVLRPVIQATVMGGMSALGMGASGSAAAGGASGLGTMLSGGKTAYDMATGGGGMYNSFAMSGFGQTLGLSTAGSSIIPASGYVLPALVEGGIPTVIAGGSGAIGAVGGTAEVLGGAAAPGALTGLGTAIPYVGLAIAAIAAITSMLGKGGGPKTEGDAYSTLTGGALSMSAADRTGDNWITGTNSNTVVESLLTPIGTSVSGLIKSMGGDASGLGFNLGFSTDPEGTAKDNIQSGVMDASGNYVYRNGRNAERGSYSTELQLEAQRMMVAAVKAADVSQVYKDVASDVDLYAASMSDLQAVFAKLSEITTLRDAFDSLGFGAENLSLALINAVGGTSAMAASLDSFYANYYTDAERAAGASDQVSDALKAVGIAMPASKEAFRSVVEGLDLTTNAGQTVFAAMMSVSSSFATVADAAAASAKVLSDAATALITTSQSNLKAAYDTESEALQTTIDKFGDFSKSLKSFRESLVLGSYSPLDATGKYSEAKAQFSDISTRAQLGDTSAIEQLQSASESFLESSRSMFASGDQYNSDFASVIAATEGTESLATRQARIADESLTTLKAQVGSLITINETVLSVYAAMGQLILATTSAAGVGGVSSSSISGMYQGILGYSESSSNNAYWTNEAKSLSGDDLLAKFLKAATAPGNGDGVAATAWAKANKIPGFATGGIASGMFMAGENGPELIYSQTPVRVLSNSQTNSAMSGNDAEIKALREEIRQLRADQAAQHRELVASNYDANDRAASKVVDGQKETAWRDNNKARYAA